MGIQDRSCYVSTNIIIIYYSSCILYPYTFQVGLDIDIHQRNILSLEIEISLGSVQVTVSLRSARPF